MEWFDPQLPHLWLPYTQMKHMPPPLPVVGAEGCRLKLADGRELVDGIASWWTACHGYRHPHIEQAVTQQLQTLPHVMLGGLVHEPALRLATRLSQMTPGKPERVFFCDSGSVAVEVALKMALQYWQNHQHPSCNRFLCFRHSYHGDTAGAMSVSDPEAMHKAFRAHATKQYMVDIPTDEYGFAELEELLHGVHRNLAGVIIEPLLQGAGGMKFYSPDVLAELYRLCKKYDLLFIADEIATGFGRLGSLFACEEAGIAPDILCLGKALTGGTMTLAAVLARDAVFQAFWDDDPDHAFMHGPTYMANPLACAAAHASLDLFEQEPRLAQVEAIEAQLHEELAPCAALPNVLDVRVKGAVGVVQLSPNAASRKELLTRFVELGVWIRPLEDVVYLMPSFTISPQDLSCLTGAIRQVVGSL